MAEEVSEAFNFTFGALKSALQPLVGSNIYQMRAIDGVWELTDYYVLGTLMSPGADFTGQGGVRLQTNPLIWWYAVKRGDIDAKMRQIDRAMDAILTNIRAQTSNGWVFSVVREQPHYRLTYDERQTPFSEVGGRYRYFIRPV